MTFVVFQKEKRSVELCRVSLSQKKRNNRMRSLFYFCFTNYTCLLVTKERDWHNTALISGRTIINCLSSLFLLQIDNNLRNGRERKSSFSFTCKSFHVWLLLYSQIPIFLTWAWFFSDGDFFSVFFFPIRKPQKAFLNRTRDECMWSILSFTPAQRKEGKFFIISFICDMSKIVSSQKHKLLHSRNKVHKSLFHDKWYLSSHNCPKK